MMPASNAREHKKQQTRQAFFNAILDLCMRGQSFASISLRQATREVGVVPTAFYRHFDDMEVLGACLVEEELGEALMTLHRDLQIERKDSYVRQIAHSIELFFASVDAHPRYWQFLISERFGGSEAVKAAIAKQIHLFSQLIGTNLGQQPAFARIDAIDRQLLAEAGLNLFLSWVMDWLDVTYSHMHTEPYAPNPNAHQGDEADLIQLQQRKQEMLYRYTRQAQMLFYGAENWCSDVKNS